MNELIATTILTGIKLWAQHNNKPANWKPSAQDMLDIVNAVDAATPEAEKAAAAARLGVGWRPEGGN